MNKKVLNMNKQGKYHRIEDYHHNTTSSNLTPQLRQGKFTVGNPSFQQHPLQKENKYPSQYISKNQNQTSQVRKSSGDKVGAPTSNHKDVMKKQNSGQNFKMDISQVVNELKEISLAVKQTNETINKTQETINKTQYTINKTQYIINQLIQKQTLTESRLDRITKVVQGWDIQRKNRWNQEAQAVETVRLSITSSNSEIGGHELKT